MLVVIVAVAALATPAPSAGQATTQPPGGSNGRHIINVLWGRFVPRGTDGPPFTLIQGRALGDVLIGAQVRFVRVKVADLRSATIGAEWLVPIGNRIEVGAGAGVSQGTAHAPHSGYVDADGTEIIADLSLRLVPISLTARVVPLGYSTRVQPYVGGGLALIGWRYRQAGEYADIYNVLAPPPGPCIFECPFEIFKPPPEDRFSDAGFAAGPVVLGGLRVAAGAWFIGGEFRYQRAVGDLDPAKLLASPRIDLGGHTWHVTAGVRLP